MDHFDELLLKVDAELRAIALERVDRGEIPFLPSQVRFKKGRIRFPAGIGWVPAPDYDPKKFPVDDIELVCLITSDQGYLLNLVMKRGKGAELADEFRREHAVRRNFETAPTPPGTKPN